MIIRPLEDYEEAREIHSLAFPHDHMVGPQHRFWVVREHRKVIGFCSACDSAMFELPDLTQREVFLSRSAVIAAASGKGVQRFMIRTRVKWALELGAKAVVTYALDSNYQSITNLIRCGFRFVPYQPKHWYGGNRKGMHHFRMDL